jgi:hypothetical protein
MRVCVRVCVCVKWIKWSPKGDWDLCAATTAVTATSSQSAPPGWNKPDHGLGDDQWLKPMLHEWRQTGNCAHLDGAPFINRLAKNAQKVPAQAVMRTYLPAINYYHACGSRLISCSSKQTFNPNKLNFHYIHLFYYKFHGHVRLNSKFKFLTQFSFNLLTLWIQTKFNSTHCTQTGLTAVWTVLEWLIVIHRI